MSSVFIFLQSQIKKRGLLVFFEPVVVLERYFTCVELGEVDFSAVDEDFYGALEIDLET